MLYNRSLSISRSPLSLPPYRAPTLAPNIQNGLPHSFPPSSFSWQLASLWSLSPGLDGLSVMDCLGFGTDCMVLTFAHHSLGKDLRYGGGYVSSNVHSYRRRPRNFTITNSVNNYGILAIQHHRGTRAARHPCRPIVRLLLVSCPPH
jgi:hypothetical protein